MNKLTPVQSVGGLLFKRDDLYEPFGPGEVNGGKMRQCMRGGITLHPNYEAKTMQWFVKSGLDPGSTLFWIVGAAPRNIPAAGRP